MTVANSNTIGVAVHFRASANPNDKRKNTGNVKTVVLKIDDVEVDRHENLPQVKEGTHTFEVDISGYPDSIVNLQAFAYQSATQANLVGESQPVALVIDRTQTFHTKGGVRVRPLFITITDASFFTG